VSHEELVVPKPLAAELDRLGLEFLSGILAIEVGRRPENLEARSDLGHILTRLGRHEEALAVDREIVRRAPECETAHYNLACSLALTGALDEAVTMLERAVLLGYADDEQMIADEDLAALRELPRFRALVERLRASSS
jgi:Flp pilus assembly protein TadD